MGVDSEMILIKYKLFYCFLSLDLILRIRIKSIIFNFRDNFFLKCLVFKFSIYWERFYERLFFKRYVRLLIFI